MSKAQEPTPADERVLLATIEDLKAQLERARELAEWFRADHERTLPVVASFRRWRMGHQTDAEFHEHLRSDTCGRAISLGTVVPMQAMGELHDWMARARVEADRKEKPGKAGKP